MDIKFFASAIFLSFITVLIDISLGTSYVFIIVILSVLSFSVSYYYQKFKETSNKTNDLLKQSKVQFVENSNELAEAYKQLIEKDNAIKNVTEIISTKIGNSVSIANSYLNLINEEELTGEETSVFIDKVLDEIERINVDTRDLIKDLTGNDTEVLYEQANIKDLLTSVSKCSESELKIISKEDIEIPCDKNSISEILCNWLKLVNGDISVFFELVQTPKSIVSSEFVKISFHLKERLTLNEKDKEAIFFSNTSRNTKKVIKGLYELRKIIDNHNGNFWILFNKKTVVNITLPIKPKFIS